jgi:hypothetical protein
MKDPIWQIVPELQIWGCPVALDVSGVHESSREAVAQMASEGMRKYRKEKDKLREERDQLFLESLRSQ